ncbi:MAG: hypothetical protein L3J68_00140 [Thermoplasmata archaeon]|nr:hypothetical protein [Thermoplasmata archaeon]
MTPSQVRVEPPAIPIVVRLGEFKHAARRLLPPNHPLLAILRSTPDELPASDLSARVGDWIVLLEAV